jgi:uncharacterized protein
VGPGRHLRRDCRLQGARTEGHRQRPGLYFRREILRPFLDHYLKDDAPKADVAPVTAFETGTNTWRRLTSWPAGCQSGCQVRPTPAYLGSGLTVTFAEPTAAGPAFDEYVSDPARPVPFRARPIQPMGYTTELTWSQWLVDDQREASGRPDVLAFVSEPLKAPMKISGQPVAHLVASTSGTDADWVVKVIDVYPDEVAGQPSLGGYQLMVSADIFRGRYRESFEHATAIAPDTPLEYRFALPTANRVFLPGHRVMVPGTVELVPAVRPQPPDVRSQHLLGEAGRLPEGGPAGVSRAGRELRGAADRDRVMAPRRTVSS